MRTKTHSHQDFSKINKLKGHYRAIDYEINYVLLTNFVLKMDSKFYFYESMFVDKSDFIKNVKGKIYTCDEKGRYYIYRGLNYVPIPHKNHILYKVNGLVGSSCKWFNDELNIYHYDKLYEKYYTMDRGMYIYRQFSGIDFYAYENWHEHEWFIKEWRIKILKDLTK